MSRRLPIYLVLDTSGSMDGAPINAVNQGLQVFQAALRGDARALETAFVSVITFDSQATQVVPLTDIASFTPPNLRASGGTSLGAALQLLKQCISREVVTTSGEGQKGDWKPLVFLMTDGQPTDSWEAAAKSVRGTGADIIACAAGDGADEQMLKSLTSKVVKISDTNEQQLKAYFNWLTAGVRQASATAGTSGADQGIALPPPPPNAGIVIIP